MITDRRAVAAPGLGASTWEAVAISTADYYPFGMLKPSGLKEGALSNGTSTDSNPSVSKIVDISMFRANSTFGCQVNNLKIGKLKTYVSYANNQYIGFLQTDGYRYVYNGMERDNEVSGNGNSYTTEFRQYDPRLGRWKSLDPLMAEFPDVSPYSSSDNNPILLIDQEGDFPGLGALFEYAWQAGTNLAKRKKGESLKDCLYGNIDFVSLAAAAVPGGSKYLKLLRRGMKLYSDLVETTANGGARVRSADEIAFTYTTRYATKKLVRNLRKLGSDKTLAKVREKSAEYSRKLNNQKTTLSKKPNNLNAQKKADVYSSKLNELRKVEVLSKALNGISGNTFDKIESNLKKVSKVATQVIIEEVQVIIKDVSQKINESTQNTTPWQYVPGSLEVNEGGDSNILKWKEERKIESGVESRSRSGTSEEFIHTVSFPEGYEGSKKNDQNENK